jgi:biotin carboxyl carrier protein
MEGRPVSARVKGALLVDGLPRPVDVEVNGAVVTGRVDDAPVAAEVRVVAPGEIVLRVGGRRLRAIVARRGDLLFVSVGGRTYEVAREGAAAGASPAARVEPFAASPMTGVLGKVHVAVGDSVAKGRPLFAVEAMKMEYVVTADRDVVISEVRRKAGDRVTIGEPIVAFR